MKAISAALFLLLGVSSALALTPAMKAQMWLKDPAHHPCAADIVKLCSAVPSGMGRKWACLREHRARLQPRCTRLLTYLDSVDARFAAAKHETVEQFRAEAYAAYAKGAPVDLNAIPPKSPKPH